MPLTFNEIASTFRLCQVLPLLVKLLTTNSLAGLSDFANGQCSRLTEGRPVIQKVPRECSVMPMPLGKNNPI